MNVTSEDLGEGVQVITLQDDGEFPFKDDPTKVLFVRPCIREIADEIIRCRAKERNGSAALVGQPGIGKSYGLFYLAHRFLQETDVEAVVLESSEKVRFHIFYKSSFDQSSLPTELHHGEDLLITDLNTQLLDKKLLCRESVVYIVDMADFKPPAIMSRSKGYTVLSSAPRPYKKHIEPVKAYKEAIQVFSPPPWSKEATKVVFEYALAFEGGNLGIKTWSREVNLPFEEYFNLFGGTLRALHRPQEEMMRMANCSTKVENTPPHKIVKMLVKEGVESLHEDFSHTLFSEVGGSKNDCYVVKKVPSKRQFRSKFTNFWFRKHIAPRVLSRHYNAECLRVLSHTIESADPAKRVVEFEDFFHKLLPLGKWNIKDLADEHHKPGPSALNAFFRFFGGGFSEKVARGKIPATEGSLDLQGVPVKKRPENEYEVNISDWTGWDADTTPEIQQDVCHLVDVWKDTDEDGKFYWIPRGKRFPGLDSVYKEGSSNLYFIQVMMGNDAEDINGWIDKAVRISTLLYEKLGRPEIKCTLLVGCEPQLAPVLGERKYAALCKSHEELKSWGLKYLVAPLPMEVKEPQDFELSLEIYFQELQSEFHSFLNLMNQEEDGK